MKRRFVLMAAMVLTSFSLSAVTALANEIIPIPAGTNLQVRLTTTLSTKANKSGDPWTGQVVEPVFAKGQEIVPAGSRVQGHIAFLKEPGRARGKAEMRLIIDTVTTREGIEYSTAAPLKKAQDGNGTKVGDEGTIKGPGKDKKREAINAGMGAGAGAAVGVIAAGGRGAEYGAAIGAGAALVRGIFKRHKDIVVTQGMEFNFVFSRDAPGKKMPDSTNAPATQQ